MGRRALAFNSLRITRKPLLRLPTNHLASTFRFQSTCTMDLVEAREFNAVNSTLHFYEDNDFDPSLTSSAKADQEMGRASWNVLLAAASARPVPASVISHDMDLVEAAEQCRYYDKVVLLVNHCEEEDLEAAEDPSLTGRGIGQALSLSRRTANFCNSETGLLPELIVVPPLRKVIETAMFSFAHYSPHSVCAAEWICHPDAQCVQIKNKSDEDVEDTTLLSSEHHTLERSDLLLKWLQSRQETVVVSKLIHC
jgi:hypothetical protein